MRRKRRPPPVGTHRPFDAEGSAGEMAFRLILLARAPDLIPGCLREYVFHPERAFRLDFAWPALGVAVEVDGGQHAPRGGRHATDADREKLNYAAALGWRVLRFSPAMLGDPDACIDFLRAALAEFVLSQLIPTLPTRRHP